MRMMKRRLLKIAAGAFLFYGLVLYVAPLFFPLPDELEAGPPQGLLFVDRDGEPVRRMLDGDLRADEPARFNEFPRNLVEATLAAEDSRFYSHNGIDYLGVLRAVKDALLHRGVVSGASTITQQTVKLYSEPRPRTLRTKVIEIFTARKLEMFADKETILTAYLNRLPYGNQFTGARAAARGYFGKPMGDLSVAEAALLAALPNKPTRYNPWRNLEGARQRQFWILGRMKEEGTLDEAGFAAARIEPIRLLAGPAQTFHAPHFVDLVAEQERELVADARENGRNVRTTLDLDLQRFVEGAVSAELARLGHEAGEAGDLQAAVVVIENATGDVLALTGSRSFLDSREGQLNGAWTPRSAGSTLKPFTYLLALERGYHAASVLADTPIEYVTSTGTYQPVNFDRNFHGPVSIRRALANSFNVPAVKLLDELGGPPVLHGLLAEDLHFTSLDEDPTEYGLGLTLGNAEVRLLELTNAYACLARLGEFKPWRVVKPEAGEEDSAARLFDRDAAWILADILSDTRARVEAFGLHSPLNLPFRAAAKTGTSTDFRDNWTVGFTPDYTVGVWVGRFNNRPLNQVSGAMGAAPIFHRVLVHLHRGGEPAWYERPASAVALEIDPLNGCRPPGEIDLPGSRLRPEWFVTGGLPRTASTKDYTDDGRSLLSSAYRSWWQGSGGRLAEVAEVISPAWEWEAPPPFRIVSPLRGTVAFLDPDLPRSGSRFPLEIAGGGTEEIEWVSPSLRIENEGSHSWLVLEPGEHEVVARDRATGREAVTRFEVRAL